MSDLEARLAALETKQQAMESEVQLLRDHLAIRQLMSRYGPLMDSTSNPERLRKAAEYYGDGIYELDGHRRYTGWEFAEQSLQHFPHQGLIRDGSSHIMAMPYVLVEGDRATAVGYSHVFRNNHDGTFSIYRASANFWEFERKDGEWAVTRRRNHLMDGTEAPRQMLHLVDHKTIDAQQLA